MPLPLVNTQLQMDVGMSERANAPYCPGGGGGWSQLDLTDALMMKIKS